MPLPTYECLRCGHKWHPRSDRRPDRCPKCNSPYWDKPGRSEPPNPRDQANDWGAQLLEEVSKVERDVREYFSSGGKEMNIFEYLKFCSEVVPGLAEMSHSETDLAVDIGDYLRVCRSDPRTMMKMDNGMGINANE